MMPALVVRIVGPGLLLLAACAPGGGTVPDDEEANNVPAVADPIFEEVAGRVGLEFNHFVGATGNFYLPEIMGSGVALLDHDGDGDLDVYLQQGSLLDPDAAPNDSIFPVPDDHRPGGRLFRNNLAETGQLSFEDVTDLAGVRGTEYGMGAATGDIDGDGDTDLYLTNFGHNTLFLNNGDGSFSDITERSGTDDPRWSASAAFLDYDRDGDLDLFVTNYVAFNTNFNKRCSDSTGQRDYCAPTVYDPLTDRLFRNEGGGRFTDVSESSGIQSRFGSGLGVTCADFNGDGWIDVYVANDQRANQLWINQQDGSFVDTALMSGAAYSGNGAVEAGMGVTGGDFDGDGDEDLFMTHLTMQSNTLYINDGSGNFIDATYQWKLGYDSVPFTGFGSEWFDYDNDGKLDLFVANGAVRLERAREGRSAFPYEQTNQLFRNQDGGYVDRSSAAGPALALLEVSRGAAFGDIDNDGDVDVVVSNGNGPTRLLLNRSGNRKHWLTLRLRGHQSNRDGIGARIAVGPEDGPLLWRRLHTDGSYLSANDPRVHFGLGDRDAPVRVTVHWPAGGIESWGELKVDSAHTLVEGEGRQP